MKRLAIAPLLLVLALPFAAIADEPKAEAPKAPAKALPLPEALTVPKEVSGDVGAFIPIVATTSGKAVRWYPLTPGLNVFPSGLLRDDKSTVVSASKPGDYRIMAWTAIGDVPTDPVFCVVKVGQSPGPDPGPGPGPDPGPSPDDPFGSRGPTAGGIKVLIVLESKDRSKLPRDQLNALTAADTLAYLNSHCATDTDGKTRCWRIWDKDVDPSADTATWQKVWKRPRASLPWIVVSNGRQWYEGALPKDTDSLLTLLKKYGGS